MNSNTSSFLAILDQENVPFDSNQDRFALEALLCGISSIDQPEGIYAPDPTLLSFGLQDFSELYPLEGYVSESPGVLSLTSLPPSPFSSADDLSDLGAMDALTLYNPSPSPTGTSVLIPLAHADDVKPTKPDLDGFEYNPITRKWVCTKCDGDFVSTHEARRHVKTAAKCTGKKVMCLRCGDHIHAAPWSRKRHFAAKKCQKKGRRRGTPTYTVNNAYVDL